MQVSVSSFLLVIILFVKAFAPCDGQNINLTSSSSLTARLVGSQNTDFSRCGIPASQCEYYHSIKKFLLRHKGSYYGIRITTEDTYTLM